MRFLVDSTARYTNGAMPTTPISDQHDIGDDAAGDPHRGLLPAAACTKRSSTVSPIAMTTTMKYETAEA